MNSVIVAASYMLGPLSCHEERFVSPFLHFLTPPNLRHSHGWRRRILYTFLNFTLNIRWFKRN
ncbi:MAG: hypothetical protein K8R07_09260, partial [Desulfobacterales bacterium]|nr:hypothetical protein [Desulfobacterales bacterium]